MLALLVAALMALGFDGATGVARAQTPAVAAPSQTQSLFSVGGVRVDVTAANAAEAQRQAFANAQRIAFERLVQRLTTAEELSARGMPRPEAAVLDRMVRSTVIEDARRSDNRYIGRLTVAFDPVQVRATLRSAGFVSLNETRAAPILVVPLAPGATPALAAGWRAAFEQGGFSGEMAPVSLTPATLVVSAPDWAPVAASAEAAGAAAATFALLRASASTLTAELIEIGPNGERRERGQVSVPAAGGEAALPANLARLASAANDRLQTEARARAPGPATPRQRLQVSALFSDQAQWLRVKSGLESAAATAISEVRIEAVGRNGALVSFAFAGDQEQLGRDLRRAGLSLQNGPQGPVLRLAQGPG
jgi:hypothetical protein